MAHDDDPKEAAGAALEMLDRALSKQPVRDGHDFSEVTRHLCRLRDLLIEKGRAGGDTSGMLGQVNGLISVSMAGQFPLGHPPWPLIEQARGALGRLMTEA